MITNGGQQAAGGRQRHRVEVPAWGAIDDGHWFGPVAAPPAIPLFLGDNGHHQASERAAVRIPALQRFGIEVTYTDKLADLNPQNLALMTA